MMVLFFGSSNLTMIGSWRAMGDTGSFTIGVSDTLWSMSCDITGRDGGGRVRGDGTGTD